jgi:two-component system, OmpR family, osmolarity sensor histidine kinase EnvZ
LNVPQGNTVLIERLVANLLDNAFTHGIPPVTLRVAATNDEWRVEVDDAGEGISPDQQQAMLQAFARGDSSRQRPGLGLGLTVVQRVAARMGGDVVFSRADDGHRHRVTVRLPLNPCHSSPKPKQSG